MISPIALAEKMVELIDSENADDNTAEHAMKIADLLLSHRACAAIEYVMETESREADE